ncbi:hypothetical protein D3C74_403890 [compost metagenome]
MVIEVGNHAAAVERHQYFALDIIIEDMLPDQANQLGDSAFLLSGEGDGILLYYRIRQFRQVSFVISLNGRDSVRAQSLQGLLRNSDVLADLRIENIGYMNQQVSLGNFFERRAERLDQMMGQLADKTDRVGQQKGFTVRKLNAAH